MGGGLTRGRCGRTLAPHFAADGEQGLQASVELAPVVTSDLAALAGSVGNGNIYTAGKRKNLLFICKSKQWVYILEYITSISLTSPPP